MSMTPSQPKKSFNPQDISTILSGLTQGASSGLAGSSQASQTRREARESKRQTYAELLNRILGRQSRMKRAQTQYGDEGADIQSQALQQMASGFIDSLRGATRR